MMSSLDNILLFKHLSLIVPLLERTVSAQRDLVKASDNNILAEVKAILDQPTDDVRESIFKKQAKLWLERSAIKKVSVRGCMILFHCIEIHISELMSQLSGVF